jgi:hypothetical protein
LTDYFSAATGLDQIGQQPQAPQATVQPVDYFSAATGLDKIGAQPSAAQQPQKKEGWGEWIANSVRGRHDPNYAAAEAAPTVGAQFQPELSGRIALEALAGASDSQMADVFAKGLGDKYIRTEKDANGYPVLVTRGPDGQEQKNYVNKPGLDFGDVARGVIGTVPYAIGAGTVGVATKGAGIGLQALAQGAAAGATSVAGDVAQIPAGSQQGVDLPKAAVTAGFGAAAPPLAAAGGALWRRFVTIPGLVDETTGQLTQKGIAAARQAGIDPADITPDFSKAFAKSFATSGDPAAAATQAGLERFGIPATKGQITKDPYLLTQEEGMRRRLYGETAQDTMRAFDQNQQDAIARSVLGDNGSGAFPGSTAPAQGIGEQINPARQPGMSAYDRMPSTLGSNVQDTLQTARSAARQQESALWDDGVKNLAATPEALKTLTPHIEQALADETAFTKTGQAMAEEIGQFAKGELPVNQAGGIKLKQIQSVDQMRRRLGALVGSAEDGTDKNQAGKIYDAFNDWIGESAKNSLLSGDPAAAMQLVKARSFTKEVRDIFQPKNADGTISSGARRIAGVLDPAKADSGEGVIQNLLGSQGSRGVNQGTVSALTNIKTALQKFAPKDAADQAWNDIRLAYWTRLVTGKNGELVGPTAMVNNIKSAIQNQSTVMGTLYQPTELRQIRELVRALETVSYKPPNASGSGYSAAQFAKEGIMKLLDSFGIGKPVMSALQYTGIPNAWNAAAAKQAIGGVVRSPRPNLAPAFAGAGQATYQSQSGR